MIVGAGSLTDACTTKFGVEWTSLMDHAWIIIYGRPLASLKHGASIRCYDDHHVTMAFSVLTTVVDGTIIEEKRCVEKTWPIWWDDLENKVWHTYIFIRTPSCIIQIGIQVKGINIPQAHPLPTATVTPVIPNALTPSATPSVLLIGMCGSRKSHIGELALCAFSFFPPRL